VQRFPFSDIPNQSRGIFFFYRTFEVRKMVRCGYIYPLKPVRLGVVHIGTPFQAII
jgi:hypothetical protein